MVNGGENSTLAIPACSHCPTAPGQNKKVPDRQNQSCKCADKQIASEDGSLAAPRAAVHDAIIPTVPDVCVSIPDDFSVFAMATPRAGSFHPPGIPLRVAYCVYRL